ncbi:protein of unknown function [Paraburkholderia kururiensis]
MEGLHAPRDQHGQLLVRAAACAGHRLQYRLRGAGFRGSLNGVDNGVVNASARGRRSVLLRSDR